ncbi:MAG: glycosyltransferase family 4 protein [Chloroflexi bacterium]|nr:glycosyltransferase family 4 protein [Chloroflexota bacterium]
MRVAIISMEFPPAVGGIAEYLGQVAWRLAAREGYEVAVWAPPAYSASALGFLPEEPQYTRHIIPSSLWKLIRALRAWHPDRVIVGHTDLRLLLAARWVAPQRYLTVTYGNDFLGAQRLWYRGLINHLLAQSRPLVAISRHTAGRLQKLGMPNPVVIYPGADPERFYPPPIPLPPPFTLLSVGRLVPRKGIDVALRVVARLRGTYPDIRYRVAGRGPERRALQHLAETLGLEDHVTFLGGVPADELPDLYREAHLFLLPLREEEQTNSIEGFGMVFLDAAATAVPSIAGRCGGAVEAVRDGETGLLIPPGDEEALYHAVLTLLEDDIQRRRLGQTGRRWVEEEMNWERAVDEFHYWLQGQEGGIRERIA